MAAFDWFLAGYLSVGTFLAIGADARGYTGSGLVRVATLVGITLAWGAVVIHGLVTGELVECVRDQLNEIEEEGDG